MKHLIAAILTLVIPLLSNGQSWSVLDAPGDKENIAAIKARLDEVRKRRPTVALVLSGGGAKGAAHVGAMHYLDSLGVPVDLVVGTSIGGLVGGMYAIGYDVDLVDSLFVNMDWNMALSDKLPRDYVTYSERRYREKYLLSIPFYYKSSDFREKRESDARFAVDTRREELHLGADDGADATKLIRENLLGSLPSGFVFGQNVNNLISSLTVGYQDSISFASLPKPFVCVASDLVSGKAKVWYSGKLNTALRSTMSIPGLFAPVKTGGMVLVDGGMRNNYPTDIARQLGADFIIGIDIVSPYLDYAQVNNLLDIISQGIDMLGRESYETNTPYPEITIKPDIQGYDMLSFDKESIEELMKRGYEAAAGQKENLEVLLRLLGKDRTCSDKSRKATFIGEKSIMVSDIEIEGVSTNEANYILELIDLPLDSFYDKEMIEDAVHKIFATRSFDYVNYELVGEKNPYTLRFICKHGPINNLGIGLRFDTEEIVSVLVNLGLNTHRLEGSAFDFTGKISSNPLISAAYRYRAESGPTINAMMRFRHMDMDQSLAEDSKMNLTCQNFCTEAYFSNISWKKYDINVGVKSDYYNINRLMLEKEVGDYSPNYMRDTYVSAFLRSRAETYDNKYFPESGFTLGLDYSWVFGALQKGINPFHIFRLDGGFVVHIKKDLTWLPSFDARFLVGEDIPLIYANTLGGMLRGRYLDQQIPFVGVSNAVYVANVLGVFNSCFRYRLARNSYVESLSSWAVHGGASKTKSGSVETISGSGLFYSYNSVAGPLKAGAYWSSLSHKVGFYFSFGFDF